MRDVLRPDVPISICSTCHTPGGDERVGAVSLIRLAFHGRCRCPCGFHRRSGCLATITATSAAEGGFRRWPAASIRELVEAAPTLMKPASRKHEIRCTVNSVYDGQSRPLTDDTQPASQVARGSVASSATELMILC